LAKAWSREWQIIRQNFVILGFLKRKTKMGEASCVSAMQSRN
jgi:hypothetical protein